MFALIRSTFVLSLMLVVSLTLAAQDRPNVILFIADDISWNDFGCYGNPAARTPHIDALAASGLRFTQAFLTASSCSPSRASIITGRYPHNTGKAAELHLPIAPNLPWFPELLREAGYHTMLVGKNHMAPGDPVDGQAPRPKAFDHVHNGNGPGNRGGHATWVDALRDRPFDKPFFGWFAAFDAHRAWDGDQDWNEAAYGPKHRPEDVIVPPFLSNDSETRADLASYYNEVTRFDHFIGNVVAELRRQGQLDNTLLLVMADNGRPFPRAKTRLHDSGMKTALVAHWPKGISGAGESTASLVSAIDLAPTILELAGVRVPETIQGVSMTPIFRDPGATIRRYAFSEHNWHDYAAHGRSVRDGRFLYIRNSRPYDPWQGPADSVRSPSHQRLLAMRKEGVLSTAQADVFKTPRAVEELYLVADDSDQLHTLVGEPEFESDRVRFASILQQWIAETGDSIPDDLSADGYDRETGEQLADRQSIRGTTPGEDTGAYLINAPGPR